MKTEQPVSTTQQLRSDIGCLLERTYPEFSYLAAAVPDALLGKFYDCVEASPSGVFLEYCGRAYRAGGEYWENALSNVFRVLPDPSDQADPRMRSARTSLAITVVADMEMRAWGTMHRKQWSDGETTWVRAAVLLVLALPALWHETNARNQLAVYMSFAGRSIRINGLITMCRERGFIDGDLVRAYLENSAAPLRVGVL